VLFRSTFCFSPQKGMFIVENQGFVLQYKVY